MKKSERNVSQVVLHVDKLNGYGILPQRIHSHFLLKKFKKWRENKCMTLQQKINFYTDKFGMKLGYVADKVGIFQSQLSGWLHNKTNLSSYDEQRIADFVSVCEEVEQFLNNR